MCERAKLINLFRCTVFFTHRRPAALAKPLETRYIFIIVCAATIIGSPFSVFHFAHTDTLYNYWHHTHTHTHANTSDNRQPFDFVLPWICTETSLSLPQFAGRNACAAQAKWVVKNEHTPKLLVLSNKFWLAAPPIKPIFETQGFQTVKMWSERLSQRLIVEISCTFLDNFTAQSESGSVWQST